MTGGGASRVAPRASFTEPESSSSMRRAADSLRVIVVTGLLSGAASASRLAVSIRLVGDVRCEVKAPRPAAS
jgi:hypothetical protein